MDLARGCDDPLLPPYIPTVPAMLRHVVSLFGDREAQVRGDNRMTFLELDRRSALLARAFLAQGVGKGARIGLLMPNTPEFTVYFMAAARIGAIVAPLSTLYQSPELAWVLRNADVQILITADRYLHHDYLDRLERAYPALTERLSGRLALPDAPYLRLILVSGRCDRPWASPIDAFLAESAGDRPEFDGAFLASVEANVAPADSLCVIYTSGSTANPKGVVHGHGPMVRHTYQNAYRYWGAPDGDRVVSLRPFFWIAGLSATLFHTLHTGGCLITADDASGATFRRLIETEGATAVCGDENWFRTLGADPELSHGGYQVFRRTMDCASIAARTKDGLRFVNPRLAVRETPAQLSQDRIARSYGMTETLGAHTSLVLGDLLPSDRPQYCGCAVPGFSLRVVDPCTRVPLAPGELGELLVAGHCMMQGIYKRELSDTFSPDGFYSTGDLCRLDVDGYLVFTSRLGEMIKIHGANVAPLEVELCLNTLAPIERSAVVGVSMLDGELVLVAAVQLREGKELDEASIRAELRSLLSSYKVPRRVVALDADAFPMTASGKIKKKSLSEILGAAFLREADYQQ